MKKIISAVMSAVLLSGALPAFAQSDKAEAVLTAIKDRIPNTEAYEEFTVSHQEYDNKVIYDFEWSSESDDNYKRMSVYSTEDNIITQMYRYDRDFYSTVQKSTDRLTPDEAMPKAEELCAKINPAIAGLYKLKKISDTENIRSNSFSFSLQRYENNLPVMTDTGYVEISLDCSEILNYSINYNADADFKPADTLLDNAAAQQAYSEKLGIKLLYKTNIDYKEKTINPYLIYDISDNANKCIDAVTGEIIEAASNDYSPYAEKNASLEMAQDSGAAGGGNSLTTVEKQQLESMANLKSKDDMLKIIKNNKYIPYSDSLTNQSYHTQTNQITKEYYATFNMNTANDAKKYEGLYITMNQETGEIKSFSYYSSDSDNNAVISDVKKAKEIALSAASQLAGKRFSEYRLRDDEPENKDTDRSSAYYIFDRYVNDIKVDKDSIYVNINSDYSVTDYSIEYTNIAFPDPANVISKEDALKKLFEYISYTPQYYNISENKYIPVYVTGSEYADIDAFSGKRLDYSGKEYNVEKIGEYMDIENHWAKDIINTLARFGVGFLGDKFLPDTSITQKEFAMLLEASDGGNIIIDPRADYTSLYKSLKSRGILKESEIAPDEPLTRETAAIMIIRRMGAEKYAELQNIYNCPFGDVKENAGYISLLYGFGIVSGSDGNFYPNTVLTRAEAAVMIYNYLNNL